MSRLKYDLAELDGLLVSFQSWVDKHPGATTYQALINRLLTQRAELANTIGRPGKVVCTCYIRKPYCRLHGPRSRPVKPTWG